jgi:hypothetical protein
MELPPLYPPQRAVIDRIERAIDDRRADTICVRSARQSGKNESWAMIACRVLSRYRVRGGNYLRTAPKWESVYANSIRRFERISRHDPLLAGRLVKHEGFIWDAGEASLLFYSSRKEAENVGATASLALDMDEAHKVDEDTFLEAYQPMTASTAAPTILWGVAAEKQDVLYKNMVRLLNAGGRGDCVFNFPAEIWCELNPAYALAYEAACNEIGENHPVIKTQWKLIDLDAVGGFLALEQIQSILAGQHERWRRAEDFGREKVYAVVDIGGEDRFDRDDTEVREEKPEQDSTAGIAFTVDWTDVRWGYPKARIVDLFYRTGARLPNLQADLAVWFDRVKAYRGVIDARGLGNQIATFFDRRSRGRIRGYMATADTISADCFDLLARLNHGQIQVFHSDDSDEYREFANQLRWTKSELHSGEKIRIIKAASDLHIDFVKALTYLRHIVRRPLMRKPGEVQ